MIIKCKLKLILKPGKASPTPPIAPILGQYGLNLIDFCNKFNLLTKNINVEFLHVKIIVFLNKNYEILLGDEPLTNCIKKITNLEKFSKKPGIDIIPGFKFNEIEKISLNRNVLERKSIFSIKKMIIGTLISIGLI